ncbi:MAG: hypothetical protein H0X65_05835 [Gemmatimonadetes bacterium]|nr:hypothetical protein [Gemmatimonadota bacterium]
MKHFFRSLLLACVVLATACATAPAPDGTVARRNPTLITAEEIQASSASNVAELIQSLRPSWVRGARVTGAGGEDAGSVAVFLNQARLGGLSELQQMTLGGITSITFVDARTATQRWGTGHSQGAIVVSTSPRS